jgi:hypothetical protein
MLLTMSKYLYLVPVLLSTLAVNALAPASAGAAVRAGTKLAPVSTQARFGGFRGTSRRPSYGSRYRYRGYPRAYRRWHPLRGVGGAILRALGLAYLFHLLFGWGAGGSPLGLLLLVALIAWLATRRLRRRPWAYY